MEARFGCGDHRNRFPVVSPRLSFTWKNILSCSDGFMEAIRWRVGDGRSTSFWHDVWLGDSALKDRFGEIFRLARDREGTVASFWRSVTPNGVWDVRLRRNPGGAGADTLPDLLRELYSVELADGIPDEANARPTKESMKWENIKYAWDNSRRSFYTIFGWK
ncbi:hypothetical protein QJS10_CPA06g01088 [Acorus calamus]|uniref:Reverse transcriptase zinc-binding domain-containing protein n=1 Tax=Acorus calamus TaxID=4465 RepID=A0AAV9EP33_ACOCL|nr:hypothetical protein QJS10_CPA06g01088 [Acorus calamus]